MTVFIFLLVSASHVTMTSWVKNCHGWEWKENLMLMKICYGNYSWFLWMHECITWPWYEGRICFFCKTHCIMYYWKENFMLINICNRIYSWFFPSWGYWPLKSWSRDHNVKGEFVSVAKPIVFFTTWKIILYWSIIAIDWF